MAYVRDGRDIFVNKRHGSWLGKKLMEVKKEDFNNKYRSSGMSTNSFLEI